MSIPTIPGYLEPPLGSSLAELWSHPGGDFPAQLWPADTLRGIVKSPSGWLTVAEHFFTKAAHGGTGCVLVNQEDTSAALARTSWIGRDAGSTALWGDETFEDGLTTKDRDVPVHFFVHARRPSGHALPIVEITHPFLWHWDAYPRANGWYYVNESGREQELIRFTVSPDSWTVEVRALEFRSFLAISKRAAIMQVDYVHKAAASQFERIDDSYVSDWANVDFHVLHDQAMGDRPAFSRLIGQYAILGTATAAQPRYASRGNKIAYPEFIYAVDAESGEWRTHSCDPDELGTYYDKDGTRLHYLTPVYFKREVLQPYAAEPHRYRLSRSRLACLDLWGLDFSFNSAGLVEVYLGDLGRDLPSSEWGHWRTYNVPPEGRMEEGRFRRDFLGQWASSEDPVRELRRSLERAKATSEELLGTSIWKPLETDLAAEFESLIGPLTDDPTALGQPLLVLTKVLVDGIDPAPLKTALGSHAKGELSLQLLRRFLDSLGDDSDTSEIVRLLQSFRSKGGIAHLAGSGKEQAFVALGVKGLTPMEAFESVVGRLDNSVAITDRLMRAKLELGRSD